MCFFSFNSMPRSGSSAFHGVNPIFKENYLCENPQISLCHFWNHRSFFMTQLVYIILAQALHTFNKNIPSECKFSDFLLLKLKFIIFLMSFFKQKVSFSLNFGSLFSVMRDNSSVLLMSFFKQKVSFSLNFGSLFSVMRDNSSVLF